MAIDINHFARSYEGIAAYLSTRLAMAEAELAALREETDSLRKGNEALVARVDEFERDAKGEPHADQDPT